MAIDTKQLTALSQIYNEAVYGKSPEQIEASKRKKNDLAGAPLTVTNADKKANTKAYQNYKAGVKGYKAADHLKDDKDWGYDKKGNSLNPVDKMKKERKKDELTGSPNVKKEGFVNWRTDLKEIPNYEEIPISAKKRNEKISEKNVKNTVKINPEMKEDVEIISEKEVDVKDTRRTVDAIRAYDKSKDASRDATYDSDEGKKGKAKKEKEYAKKERGEIDKDDPNWKKKKYHTGMHGESYETKKTGEVLSAFKRDPKVRKRFEKAAKKEGGPGSAKNRAADDMLQTAKDIAKRKGDTSKSDDRYAYESKLWDEVAANLTELGELGGVKFKVVPLEEGKKKKYGIDDVDRAPGKPNTLTGTKGYLKYAEKMVPGQNEGYQRDPEGGEEKERKAKRERKGGYDEKREKRMSSPTRGIDSPAFKEFMRSRGM